MIQIDMDMPLDCRHCNFAIKLVKECKCLVMNKKIHESWFEKTLDDPMRPLNCPLHEVKTGHWIHFAASDDCSECGWSTGKYISPSKYCPNCGAKMIDPQESEDKE